MAAALLVLLGCALLGMESGWAAGGNISTSIVEEGARTRLTCTLNSSAAHVLGHRWRKGDRVLQEDAEPGLTTELELGPAERSGRFSCTFLPEPAGRTARLDVKGPPRVEAVAVSVLGIEGERAVLVCTAEAFPPVAEWAWYRLSDTGDSIINNRTHNTFVVSSDTRTELHKNELNLQEDAGQYACSGTNGQGEGLAIITLRLRSRLAALWPFLGVLAEVVVLVTIIFACEKCRKPEAAPGVEDTGSAPPKSGH